MRSRSPTLRKTETHDIYRTFIDLPEGAVEGAPIFSNDQIICQDELQVQETT